MKVREFEHIKRSICQGEDLSRGQYTPFTILSIDYQGNFMTFSPELLSLNSSKYGEFVLGNIKDDSLESACNSEKFKKINGDIQAGVELCRETCEYYSVCGGGAPANKYFENGSFNSTQTMYCKYTKKMLLDIILNDIEQSFRI